MDFEKDVYPVVDRYARKVFGKDDELHAICLVLAWWIFTNRPHDYPASNFARFAVRNARDGRDLPGVQDSKFRDVYDNYTKQDGGDMNGLPDKRPGPAKVAEWKEEMDRILDRCTPQQQIVAEAIMGDMGATVAHLAKIIGKSQGRVSQIRREIFEITEDDD